MNRTTIALMVWLVSGSTALAQDQGSRIYRLEHFRDWWVGLSRSYATSRRRPDGKGMSRIRHGRRRRTVERSKPGGLGGSLT
jgi:hypothetical protein